MGSRYGEWISDVERPQSGTPDQSGYSGTHILYQDVIIPAVKDGTSNTIMVAEKFQFPDGEYVLTAVQHAGQTGALGEDSRGLWQINIQPSGGEIRKGGWILDVSHGPLPGENAVAMETLTIAHEGILLLI